MFPAACQGCEEVRRRQQSPYRLVVRTSRCGRDNPGSTPGVVMQVRQAVEIHDTDRTPDNRLRCQVWVMHTHSRLEHKVHVQRPGRT